MDVSLQALEQITSPLEIANLLGKDLNREANSYYTTPCPKCDNKLFIIDKELVCENSNCVFRAGSVCDYLVASGKCNWDNLIDTLNNILDRKLDSSILIKNKKLITQKVKDKRKLFDFFLRIGLRGSVNNMGVVQFKNALRYQGIDTDLLQWSVFIISGADVEKFKAVINRRDLNLNDTCILLPYFSNYHTVSHVVVLNSPTSKPEIIPAEACRVSYFGLLHRHPNSSTTKFAFTYADAAKLNTQYGRLSPENVCLHMHLDATEQGSSLNLSDAQYVITDENNYDFKAVAILQKYVNNLNVITPNSYDSFNDKTISADDFLAIRLIKEIKNGNSIIPLLELVDLKASSRQLLLNKLHENRYFDAAAEVRSFFQSLPVYSDDKYTLYKSPFGYSVKKYNKDNSALSVTNFTIDLEENIVFAESTDIFHVGNVNFDGAQYPFIVKQEDIDRPNDLEKAVRKATLSAPSDYGTNLPTIKERGAAKHLVTHLRECISCLPRSEGVPILGWSPRRTSFYAPYFIADRKGSRVGKKHFHPNNQTLTIFANDISDVSQLHLDLPEPITQIINQCAAMIVRSYLSMPSKAIPVYNNAEARALLSSLFSALGQTSVSQLNHNIRGEDSPGIRGFPHYAVGYVCSQANKSSLSAFILCDGGLVINEYFNPSVLEKGKQTLKYVIQKVAEWSIKTEAASFSQVNSVSRTNAYSIEGCQIVIDACNLISWPSSKTPFESLDNLLAGIRLEEVKQYFVKDINRHIMQIKKEALKSVNNIDGLTKELKAISKHVDINEDTIDVDSDSMIEALSSYYHTTPVLTEQFDADKLLDSFNIR